MNNMFYGCTNLQTISQLDASKVTIVQNVLGATSTNSVRSLTVFGGFKDLGKAFTTASATTSSQILTLTYCTSLTHESLMNVINNLYDLNLNGKAGTLALGTTNRAKLTDDEIAIATNKGWTVS